MRKLIEKQFIQGKNRDDIHYTTLDNIDYGSIYWGFYRSSEYSDNLIQENELYFSEYLTDQEYTSECLFYYPDLVKQFRKNSDFEKVTKRYPIDKKIKGASFLFYLARYALECEQDFKTLKLIESKKINHILQLYGYDRYMPIIQKVETEKEDYREIKSITINGVKWYNNQYLWNKSQLEKIDFRRLLNISNHYRYVEIESALINTPFIAIRCCTHEQGKGHVFWYNLATLEKARKAEAQHWKKPAW